MSQTQALKGAFVLLVFFSHICSYVASACWWDTPRCAEVGQAMWDIRSGLRDTMEILR